MVNLEMSIVAISVKTCLMGLAYTSFGIRTVDAVFATWQSESLASGLDQNPSFKLHFGGDAKLPAKSLRGRDTIAQIAQL